ncbi:hypothetical protein [Bradyrhizobium erythrophlei]|jgi:hypothetical protein|uniref:hypothetical protein n=1 Tax=Bradyrhizobium erythrophlei TaxID=1437360 RepID=UPI0012EC7BF9|nr:hypothetical protein [Bradyrhizobium erythrophlei]
MAVIDAIWKCKAGVDGVDILLRSVQVEVASFTFKAKYKIATGCLPIVTNRAAIDEAAA